MYDMSLYLKKIDDVISKGPYSDDWSSLSAYKVPEWYRRAKFGIFIHWGVFSVPAFGNEWYSRNMYIKDSNEYLHHIKTYGKHTEFGYKDFIPMFRAEKFDPQKWAELFAASGAKYPRCRAPRWFPDVQKRDFTLEFIRKWSMPRRSGRTEKLLQCLWNGSGSVLPPCGALVFYGLRKGF